jgi:hypothetical protein
VRDGHGAGASETHAVEVFGAVEFVRWFGDAPGQLLDRTEVVVSEPSAVAFEDNDGF